MLLKKRLSHDVARDRGQLLLLLFDPGELDFFFARDRLLRHGRVEQNIGEQIHAEFQIGLRDIDRHAETVVAGRSPMQPPTASISSAICSAVRVLVPFSSTFAIRCVMPLSCGVSASKPPRKTAAIDTSGRRESSRTRRRSPFDNSNFWISPAAIGFRTFRFGSRANPFGFSEMIVRLLFR